MGSVDMKMKTTTAKPLIAPALLMAGALVLAACGGDGSANSTAAPAETSTTAQNQSTVNGTVTVYTGRHYGIEPVFEAFTAATGIKVRFTTGSDPQLRERLKAEGKNTPADVLMTADAGSLALAAADGLLASLDSPTLTAVIPEALRDPDGRWFALSRRARVIMVSDRVAEADQPTTYAGVGDPAWKGRICLRPATHPYTQSLVASLIKGEGTQRAEEIVSSWVKNEPTYIDSDTKILEAIAAGECDLGITNSYYLGRLISDKGSFPVRLVWPEQADGQRGVHVNISGVAVTANAANPAAAQALIEWLATDGQQQFADVNNEFPANESVSPNKILQTWGSFRVDSVWVGEFGRLQSEAVMLLDRAGYQ